MAVPVATYLRIAEVCQYLAGTGESRKSVYNTSIEPKLSRQIYIVRDNVQWLYDGNPTNATLDLKANYLYSLCYPYVTEANRIINSGTTGNIVNPSTGQNVTIETPFVQFVIGEPGANMIAGDTSLFLAYTGIVNPSVEIDLDGSELAYNRSDRLSFTASYASNGVTIVFNLPVQDGQLYAIHLVRMVPV